MANAADKMAVMTENLRDMGLDDESVAKCLQMVESGQYQALDCFLKSYRQTLAQFKRRLEQDRLYVVHQYAYPAIQQ